MDVLVDGRHSRTGGGRSFLRAVLVHWCELSEATDDRLYVLTGDEALIDTVQAPQIVWCRGRQWHPLIRQTIGQLAIWRLSRNMGVDAIYLPGNFGLSFAPRDTPVVVTLQNPHLPESTEADAPWSLKMRLSIERAFFRSGARNASAVTTISHAMYSGTMRMVGERTRVVLIRSGGAPPPTGDSAALPAPLHLPVRPRTGAAFESIEDAMQEPYVLTVGNFYLHKHHERVVELCAAAFGMLERPPRLVVVGNGGQRSAVRRFEHTVTRLAYPVRRLEGLDAADLRILYRRCMAYVSASTREAYPLTPEEADKEGAAVVLSDIPAHREVLPSAFFFPPGDPASGAAILRDVVSRYSPEEGRYIQPDDNLSSGWQAHAAELRLLFSQLAPGNGG